MHPLISVYIAEAIQRDRLEQAERRRLARRAASSSTPVPRPRAPWSPGWSPHQAGLPCE